MPRRSRAKGTTTSAFGSPGRRAHDATRFYTSRLYAGIGSTPCLEGQEVPVPEAALDRIFAHSCEDMSELPDNSIHLMVTSPPYNVGKEYDEDLSLEEYLAFLRRVWREVYRVLVPGGRAAINVANLGRKPYIPLHAYILRDLLDLGFLMRGEIIWNKAASASPSTAWGSWCSPSNPTLRDVHEYILVCSKGSFRRRPSDGRQATITRDDFLEWTKSVWTFAAEPARKVGHPAPFPLELPRRLIQLYTYAGDVVLDPFMGSGQVAIAAALAGRHYVGYETEPAYVQLAERRIAEALGGKGETTKPLPR